MKCYLDTENAIPNHQFGLRKKQGTVEQVDQVRGEIIKCYEQKKILLYGVARRQMYKIKRTLPMNTQ